MLVWFSSTDCNDQKRMTFAAQVRYPQNCQEKNNQKQYWNVRFLLAGYLPRVKSPITYVIKQIEKLIAEKLLNCFPPNQTSRRISEWLKEKLEKERKRQKKFFFFFQFS